MLNSTDASTDRAQAVLLPKLSPYKPQQNYLGGANTLTASSFPPAFYPIRTYYGAYVEDNYRATQNLTLNLGVRYEYIGSPAEKTGRFGGSVSARTRATVLMARTTTTFRQKTSTSFPRASSRFSRTTTSY